ncbi:MAG: outer membrane beta-barrel protein [Bacteroidales bacterium]|nr:outer membrane beta-barrel protein [Bacteroidales bacterium]
MRRLLWILILLLAAGTAGAQDNFIFDMPNDFAALDTVPTKPKFKNIHMIGVSYTVNLSGVTSTPKIGQERIWTFKNFGVSYTYYHAMWNHLFNFGVVVGAKHGYEGFTSPYDGYGETFEILEFPLLSQFKIDLSRFRVLINLGPYYGYRLSTDKEGGFTKYDQRHDYGVIAGAGFAVVFKPLEFHIEANYKYALASIYHTNKYSDIYWIFTYPQNIMISASLHVHLW